MLLPKAKYVVQKTAGTDTRGDVTSVQVIENKTWKF